jgi:hypothetical protein
MVIPSDRRSADPRSRAKARGEARGDPNIEVTMNRANGGIRAGGANAPVVPDRLLALTTEALAFVSRDRAESMARQWLAGAPFSNSNEQSVLERSTADDD